MEMCFPLNPSILVNEGDDGRDVFPLGSHLCLSMREMMVMMCFPLDRSLHVTEENNDDVLLF